MTVSRLICAITVAVALLATAPAHAQRQSLADRVARLEAQNANNAGQSQSNLELLNRLTAMESEVRSLRGLVEQLQNENTALKQRAREQYIDLDSRMGRLEGGNPAGAANPDAASAATPNAATQPEPAAETPADPSVAAADPADERQLYDSAFQSLRDGDYAEASRRFQSYLQAFPQGGLAANAWYWLGESYYVTQNYDVALNSFKSLLDQFPQSNKSPDALLKLGYCQFELNQPDQAESTLRDVVSRYPDSDAARLAQSRLRSLALENR